MIASMTADNVGALIVAVLLTVYLLFALLRPEKF